MNIENKIFAKYEPNFENLIKYGFSFDNNKFTFEKYFMNKQFKASVVILKNGEIIGNVFDVENDDKYLPLRVENQQGAFVGEVRSSYENILTDIRDNCFSQNNFYSTQANRIAEKILKKYNDKPVFMWEKYPTFGVFKNPENDKWYGLIMYIQKLKLGIKSNDSVEVINIKLDSEEIPSLVTKSGIYPAYHMNKKYWVSVILDDTLSDNEIMKYIDISHNYTLKKK